MEAVQFSVTGSEANLSELNQFLRERGVVGKPGAEAANVDGVLLLFALLILAKHDTFSKCIKAFMQEKKKRIKIFREGVGWIELENYPAEEIQNMLSAQHSLHVEDQPKKDEGQIPE
jgi:hypothetical protein